MVCSCSGSIGVSVMLGLTQSQRRPTLNDRRGRFDFSDITILLKGFFSIIPESTSHGLFQSSISSSIIKGCRSDSSTAFLTTDESLGPSVYGAETREMDE